MKTKTKKTALTVIICLFFVVAAVLVPVFSGARADYGEAAWEEISVSASALVDETFTLPSRYVVVGGEKYDAEVKLRCPSGITLRKTDTFADVVFDQAGKYVLAFEAKDANGNRYKDEIDIIVAEKLWRTSDSKSSVWRREIRSHSTKSSICPS